MLGNRKYLLMPLLVIALVGNMCPHTFCLDNPAFFKGFRHMSKRNWDEAIMYFNVSIRREPDYLPAYSQLASCYERKKDFLKAKEVWTKYAEFDSYFRDAVVTHIKLINDYLKIKELSPTEAIATLENIIEKDKYPSSVLFLYAAETLSQLYFDNKLHVRTIPLLDKIALYYAQDVTEHILFKLAYSHQKEGEYQKALDVYKKLDKEFKLTPDYVDKCKNLASLCYEALGDEDFAVDEWDKARENYLLSVKGFPGAGNISRVRQKELKVQEQLAFMYKTEGDSSVMDKNYSEAMRFYQRVVDECPQSSQCGYAFTKIGQIEKKKQLLFRSAMKAYESNKHDEAITRYRQFLTLFKGSEEEACAKFWLGCSYAAVKNYREAVRCLITIAKEHPDNGWAPMGLYKSGIYYWQRLEEPQKGLKILRYVVAKYPESMVADDSLYFCGVIHMLQEDYKRAYMDFRSLVSKFPESGLARRAKVGMVHARKTIDETEG